MTRRHFIHGCGASAAAAQIRRPSVLFLMADQLRFDCLGVNGNPILRTPNLDRLATEGANFGSALVQSPVCVPSRISFFTGRYPHSHKNRVNYTPCDPREVLAQRIFQQAGYRTGSAGKLHLYPPTAEHARSTGFEVVHLDDGVAATDRYSDYVRWRNAHDPQAPTPYQAAVRNPAPGKNPFRAQLEYQYTPTAWVGSKTRELLREFAASPQPFFLYASFFKPHAPHTVPQPYDAMYDQADIPLPARVILEDLRRLPPPVQALILRGRPEYDMDRTRLQWIYRSYYAGVSMVDHEVGLILEELERSGRAGDTIVILSTDHGDQLLEHGLQGKNVFFEASLRIPLVARLPGRIRPGRYRELIETVDVLPSLLDLCGLPAPLNCQGRSFAGLVTGGAYAAREAAFAENIIPEVITGGSLDMPFVPGRGVGGIRHPDAKMVRTPRFKLNYYPGHGGELYDLEEDPGETRNLYRDPSRGSVVRELEGRLLDWMITADETDQIAERWRV